MPHGERETPHDRQAEAEARLVSDARIVALELFKDRTVALGFDARSRIRDIDADAGALQGAGQKDAAAPCIAQRIRQKILQDTPQHQRIGQNRGLRAAPPQDQAALRGKRREFGEQIVDHAGQGHAVHVGLGDAGIELRQIEQGF